MADARNFRLLSDYPMDKISFLYEDQVSNKEFKKTIKHGLPFRPIILGTWSKTSDFTGNVYDIRCRLTPAGSHQAVGGLVSVNDTDIEMIFVDDAILGGSWDSSAICYFRLFGFSPDDTQAISAGGVEINNRLMISSDYDYAKLYQTGKISPGQTISHGFGYLPKIVANSYDPNNPSYPSTVGTYKVDADNIATPKHGLFVSDEQIKMQTAEGVTQSDIRYRLYIG